MTSPSDFRVKSDTEVIVRGKDCEIIVVVRNSGSGEVGKLLQTVLQAQNKVLYAINLPSMNSPGVNLFRSELSIGELSGFHSYTVQKIFFSRISLILVHLKFLSSIS